MAVETTRREGGLLGPSTLALALILIAAAIGAISLVRQRPDYRLAAPIPPPAWALPGHDAARSGHSLSVPARLPITRRWGLQVRQGARAPVIDGANNAYLARDDGALLALDAQGNTRWCAAMQPITDTSCAGTLAPLRVPPPVTPNATIIVGPDNHLYVMVVGYGGALRPFVPSSPTPLHHRFPGLVPADGVAYNPGNATFYGVTPAQRPRAGPAYAVVALHWPGNPVWRAAPIPSRALTPVSIAPDGTLLVAAAAPAPGGRAVIYALDSHGAVRWSLPLAPGRPSFASVGGTGARWIAWVAVAGTGRSWVVAVDAGGHALWRWSTGHPLDVVEGGVALAHPAAADVRHGLAYVGSSVGVYALDLARRRAWLFFDTRAAGAGAAGPPTTDAWNTVYLGTASGRVYDVWPDGKVRWRYDTGRDTRHIVTLAPDGTVLVTGHDANGASGAGGDVVEALGAEGQPVQTVGAAICAPPDCPTATATPTPTATLTATATTATGTPSPPPITPTATSSPLPITPTSTATAITSGR